MKFEINDRLSYLGMEIEETDVGTIIDMIFFICQLLNKSYQEVKVMNPPGTKETFMVDEKLDLLQKKE